VEGRAPGRAVGVLEVEDGAGQRDVARDALAGERQPRGAERKVDGIVLGEDEAQIARAVGRLLDQVERAGVAVRDLARLGQDGLDEIARVALGREPDADRVELREFAVEPCRLGGSIEIGESVFDAAQKDRRAHARWQHRVPVRRPRPRGIPIDQRHDAKRHRVRAQVGSIATDQHDGGSFGRGVGRRGQRGHVEFATDKLGGGRRCARGRVVQDTAATHETKVGPRWRPSQEYL